MILVIDNYDSFTYNLVQYIGELGYEVIVKRNDEITCEEVSALNPEKIVISPGPCTPLEAGISVEIIKTIEKPILGVCLGHQAIGDRAEAHTQDLITIQETRFWPLCQVRQRIAAPAVESKVLQR